MTCATARPVDIRIFDAKQASRHVNRLAEILHDSVERGALIGFVLPFGLEAALTYWHGIFRSIADGERLLFCAVIDGEVAGTVQLYLSPEPNAPHRAEVFKLLVHRDFQRRGIGAALMHAAEEQATGLRRSLLLLDTAQGSDSECLYRRLGWQEIGVVPRHFVDPFGRPRSSVYFMKLVD